MLAKRMMAAGLAAALLLSPPVLPIAVAGERPTSLVYTSTKLENGLWVVLHEDHSTPIVHVSVTYHVGSKNEKAGRDRVRAPLRAPDVPGQPERRPGSHQSFIASIGGESNATTNEDSTKYWETVPAHYLPLALWLEADRMASLKVEQSAFTRERSVVKEERRQRVDSPPYGRLADMVYDATFTKHPYKHQVIGSMEDLEAARIEDVRDFFETYYVPENAVLVIAGDFDAPATMELVQRYFGRVPKAKKPVPRDMRAEPAPTAERRLTVYEDVPLPAVVVAHHITYDGHPDSYPLHIVNKVLSDGNSSRIYRSLVYEKRLALAAFGGGNIVEHPNLFFATAVVQPGQSTDATVKALTAELDRLRDEPITERELERTKNQWARDYLLTVSTVQDKADTLATPPSSTTTWRPPTASSTSSSGRRSPTSSAWRGPTSRQRPGPSSPSCRAPAPRPPRRADDGRGAGPAARARAAGRADRRGAGGGLRPVGGLALRASAARPRSAPGVRSRTTSCAPWPTACNWSSCGTNEQPVVQRRLLVRGQWPTIPPTGPASPRWSRRCSTRARRTRSAAADRRHHRLHGRRARTGAGTDLSYANTILLQSKLDEGLQLLADVIRRPAFSPRSSSDSASSCCRRSRSATRIRTTSPAPWSSG